MLGTIASQNEGFAEKAAEAADIPVEVEGVVDDMLTALRDRVSDQSYMSSVLTLVSIGHNNSMVSREIHRTYRVQGSGGVL